MAWSIGSNVTAGSVLTASRYNQDVLENLNVIGGSRSTYTPTLTNVSVGTGGSASASGSYIKAGKLVIFKVKLVLGTSSASVSGLIGISLPAAASAGYQETASFSGMFVDAGAGLYAVMIAQETASRVDLYAVGTNGTYASMANTSATVPFTWAANDQIHLSGVYEAAS